MNARAIIAAVAMTACHAESEPAECPDIAPTEAVPLPAGYVDADCALPHPLDRCARVYEPEDGGTCVRGWDCECALELEACLGGEATAPSICDRWR